MLIGGDGDDELDGGDGTDMLVGGAGDDLLTSRTTRATRRRSPEPGRAGERRRCGETENLGLGIEDLRGGTGNDTLSGNDGERTLLDGGRGADTIAGGGGTETVDYRPGR